MSAVKSKFSDSNAHAERVLLHSPLTISPFIQDGISERPQEEEEEEEEEDVGDRYLQVKTADEVPWIDLILEIAMTTALANLTNNTTISSGIDVLGYLCFWGLTWWAWASTVAYNIRFRQADWLHRVAAILQLAVFGALAAFTQDFDITSGLGSSNNPSQQRANTIMMQLGDSTPAGVNATAFQQSRAPILNFRGIAMTMAWSRVLLMVQYIIVYIYVPRESPHRYAPAILVHIVALAISAACFFISFGVIGSDPTIGHEIVKIVLWYTPLLIELAAHFIPPALNVKGHVRYSPKGLYSRASVLFLIVLGQGLDSITGTFSYAVGPAGFGKLSIGLLISTAIILIGQFALFFGSPSLKKKSLRGLLWFFGQYAYTCALIVLVSAVVNELILANYEIALNSVTRAMFNVVAQQVQAFPTQLSLSQLASNDSAILMKAGIAPTDISESMFASLSTGNQTLSNSTLYQNVLKTFLSVAGEFDLGPKQTDPVYWDFQLALSSNFTVNQTDVDNVLGELLKEHNNSLTWFPGAAGGTFIIFAILRFIRQTPRDPWEWANIATISLGGIGYMLLSFLDLGSGKPKINLAPSLSSYYGSPVFSFVQSGWVLPSFALLNLVVLLCLGWQNLHARAYVYRHLASSSNEVSEGGGRPESTWELVPTGRAPTGLPSQSLEKGEVMIESPIGLTGPSACHGLPQTEVASGADRRASTRSNTQQTKRKSTDDPFKITRNDSFRKS